MRKLKLLFLKQVIPALALTLAVTTAYSQTDTEFWFAVPEVTSGHSATGGEPTYIHITTYNVGAEVEVSMPMQPLFTPIKITLPANSTRTIDLTSYIRDNYDPGGAVGTANQNNILESGLPADFGIVTNKGIRIISTAFITAALERANPYNSEIWTLKGKAALGTEFYVPSQNTDANGNYTPNAYNSIDIVAAEDAVVWFQPPSGVDIQGYGTGVHTATMTKGQTLNLTAINQDAASHLGGTRIWTTNGKIAVQWKDDSVEGANSKDLQGDQIVPTEHAGNEYIVTRTELASWDSVSNTQELVYIMGIQGNTEIKFASNANTPANITINTGEIQSIILNNISTTIDALHISSTNGEPFIVYHTGGFGTEKGATLVPPSGSCYGSLETNFTRTTSELFFLNITCKTTDIDGFSITFEGSEHVIPSAWFTQISGTEWSYLNKENNNFTNVNGDIPAIPVGKAVSVKNTKGLFHLATVTGGLSSGCKYGYWSEFSQNTGDVFNGINSDFIFYCYGDTVQLQAKGGLSYSWANINSNPHYPGTFVNDITNISSPKIAAPTGQMFYEVTLTRACELINPDTVIHLSAIGYPEITASFDTTSNIDGTEIQTTNTSTGADRYTWLAYNETDTINTTDENPVFDFTTNPLTKDYNIKLISSLNYNCPDTFSITHHIEQYVLRDTDVEVTNGTITNCSYDFAITDIIIPETLDGQTVTHISNNVFDSLGITSIHLPSTLDSIGNYAFHYNFIDRLDLSRCTNIHKVGEYAFYENLIDTVNFSNCTQLEEIGHGAFENNLLTSLDLTDCNLITELKGFGDNVTLTESGIQLPPNITTLGQYAFYGCNFSGGFTIPSTVAKIGEGSLGSCSLTNITIPTSVVFIEGYAFSDNPLSTITLPYSEISGYQFSNWTDGNSTTHTPGSDVTDFTTSYTAAFTSAANNNTYNGCKNSHILIPENAYPYASDGTVEWTHEGAGFFNEPNIASPLYMSHANDGNIALFINVKCTTGVCMGAMIADTAYASFTTNTSPVVEVSDDTQCERATIYTSSSVSGGSGTYTSYQWLGDTEILDDPTSGNPQIIYTTPPGEYTLILNVTDDNECEGIDTATFIINDNPEVTINNTSLCYGNSKTMVPEISGGTQPYSYTWNDGSNILSTSNTQSPDIKSDIASGLYTVELIVSDNNNCSATDNAVVTVYDNPEISLPNQNLCYGSSYNIDQSVTSNSGNVIDSYAWTFDSGLLDTTNVLSPSVNIGAAAGDYNITLSVTDNESCSSLKTMQLTVTEIPETPVAINGPTSVNAGEEVTYSVGGSYNYTWTIPEGWSGDSPYASITTTAGTTGGTISVSAKNQCGESTPLDLDVYIKQHTVGFAIDDGTNSIYGAEIILNNETKYTDTNGETSFTGLITQNYIYTIKKEGYRTIKDTVKPEAGVNISLGMQEQYAKFISEISNLEVSFTNQSTFGNLSNFSWNFGDGYNSQEPNPTYTYSEPGFYNVCLSGYDSETGDIVTTCNEIEVNNAVPDIICKATFDTLSVNDLEVSFSNTSAISFTEYLWKFGDGSVSTQENPVHSFPETGYYTIEFSAYNSANSCFAESEMELYVEASDNTNSFCLSDFNYLVSGDSVIFTNKSQGVYSGIFWDFGNNTFSVNENPVAKYTDADFYKVCLSVYDSVTGNMDESCNMILITEVTVPEPVCNAEFRYFTSNRKVSFSNKSAGNADIYFWDMGDGNYYNSASDFNHTYTSDGLFEASLTIFNETSGCIDTYTEEISVTTEDTAFCRANFSFVADSFNVVLSDKSTGVVTDHFWHFGDDSFSTEATPKHTYKKPGCYDVYHSIYNSETGCIDEVVKKIVITRPQAKVLKAQFTYVKQSDDFIRFKSESLGSIESYFWDFDDGTNSNSAAPAHKFNKAGYYNVSLTVRFADSVMNTVKKKVFVKSGSKAAEPVYADFVHNASTNNLSVIFNNRSFGSVENWYWDFGDNSTPSTDTAAVHTYTESGYYNVCLTANNSTYQNTNCKTIIVGDITGKHSAFYNYFADTATNIVYFENGSLGDIASYTWNFGDGVISNEEIPAHTYTAEGIYGVCLTTESVSGSTKTFCQDINVTGELIDTCVFNCVWPGDANNDNEANHYDILTIGMNFGMVGPSRFIQTDDWGGYCAFPWANYQIDSTNNMHGDCNGDGIINIEDTAAISSNFAYSHTPNAEDFSKAGAWTLSHEISELPSQTKGAATTRVIRSILSEPSDKAANEIYGFGYDLELVGAEGVDWDNISVDFNGTFLTPVENDLITFYRVDQSEKSVYISLSRKDQQNTPNGGSVATVYLPFADSDLGQNISVIVTSQGGIMADGTRFDIVNGTSIDAGDDIKISDANIDVFPNPNKGSFKIQSAFINNGELNVEVYDIVGKTIFSNSFEIEDDYLNQTIDLGDVPQGVYTLKAEADGQVVIKRIVVQ